MTDNDQQDAVQIEAAKTSSWIIPLLKLSVTIALLYVALRIVPLEDIVATIRGGDLRYLIAAYFVFLAGQFASALRYLYVAQALSGHLTMRRSLFAHFVGLFFNQLLPTSLGGDAVKCGLLRGELGFGRAVRTTLLDRMSGLAVLLLSLVILYPAYVRLFDVATLPTIVALSSAVGVILLAASPSICRRLSSFNPKFLTPLLQVFLDIGAFAAPKRLGEQFLTSSVVHFCGILSYALIGASIGVEAGFLTYLAITPMVFVIALVPVAMAGWGPRELGSVILFGTVGIAESDALAMAVLFGIILLVSGLPGAIMFLMSTSRRSIR
jgi:hypothetical protein